MVCVLCGGPMADADEFAHSFIDECQRFTEERMKTVHCKGCGLPLESEATEEEALAEEQRRDSDVKTVEFYCQVCLALKLAENPDAEVMGDSD